MSDYASFSYAAYGFSICALVHLSSLLIGPNVIEFLALPPNIANAALNGYWMVVVSVIMVVAICFVFLAWLCFRARSPKVLGRLSRAILWCVAVFSIVRGLSVVMFMPAMLEGNFGASPLKVWFFFWASIFILTIGVALVSGLLRSREKSA